MNNKGFKKKTINAVLSKKFNQWLESIDSQDVRNAVEKNTIITGGAIASMFQGEKPKDFDLYFTDKETVKLVAKYYVEKFKENIKKKGKQGKVRIDDIEILDGEEVG